MIHANNRSPFSSWLAVAALCVLMAAPAPLAAAAAADSAAPGSLVAWAADWWSGLAGGWWAVAAEGEVAPDADPNGFSATPLPEGDLTTAESPQTDGEAAPNADPNG